MLTSARRVFLFIWRTEQGDMKWLSSLTKGKDSFYLSVPPTIRIGGRCTVKTAMNLCVYCVLQVITEETIIPILLKSSKIQTTNHRRCDRTGNYNCSKIQKYSNRCTLCGVWWSSLCHARLRRWYLQGSAWYWQRNARRGYKTKTKLWTEKQRNAVLKSGNRKRNGWNYPKLQTSYKFT